MTLEDFLLARIAEDEEAADAENFPYGTDCFADLIDMEVGKVLVSPARVLAECEAKRRIVGEHRLWDGRQESEGAFCSTCAEYPIQAYGTIGVTWPCLTLRALSLPYADRPDYRPEWRP